MPDAPDFSLRPEVVSEALSADASIRAPLSSLHPQCPSWRSLIPPSRPWDFHLFRYNRACHLPVSVSPNIIFIDWVEQRMSAPSPRCSRTSQHYPACSYGRLRQVDHLSRELLLNVWIPLMPHSADIRRARCLFDLLSIGRGSTDRTRAPGNILVCVSQYQNHT